MALYKLASRITQLYTSLPYLSALLPSFYNGTSSYIDFISLWYLLKSLYSTSVFSLLICLIQSAGDYPLPPSFWSPIRYRTQLVILDTHFIPVHSVVPHIIQVIFLAQLVMTDQSIREKFNRGPNVSETDIFFGIYTNFRRAGERNLVLNVKNDERVVSATERRQKAEGLMPKRRPTVGWWCRSP